MTKKTITTTATGTITPEIHLIRGKVKYSRVFSPQKGGVIKEKNKDTGAEELKQLPDTFSTVLLIDDDNRDIMLDFIEKYKLSKNIKRDKERDESLSFTRDVQYNENKEVLNPVQYIVDNEGNRLTLTDLKDQGSDGIGNGSDCTIAFRLREYTTSMGKRNKTVLVGLQVHSLVPYTKPLITETNPFAKTGGSTSGSGHNKNNNPF